MMHPRHRMTRRPNRRTQSVPKPQQKTYWAKVNAAAQVQEEQAQQTKQKLALALAAISPLFFATHFLKFNPEPAQIHVLKNAHFSKRIALNCNRQWGKSTIAAILILHRLFFTPKALVLLVAPADRQSGETFLKVQELIETLGPALILYTRPDGISKHSLVLPNGARLVSLPAVGRTTRGFSKVSMLVFDEAAHIKDTVYWTFRPTIAVGDGDIILVSTPAGRRGFFFKEMAGAAFPGADPSVAKKWFRHTGPVDQCRPRISQDTIDEEKSVGDRYFQQEWLCEFIETGLYAIDEMTLNKIIKKELEAYQWV